MGVTIQIAKSPNATAADFRATMADKWQRINAKNGGTLFGKTFIPFRKEGDMGDAIMTNVIQQQHKFLAETKQRIVHNLNNVDEIIEIQPFLYILPVTKSWVCLVQPSQGNSLFNAQLCFVNVNSLLLEIHPKV
jgi:hypothetical protein